MRLILLGLPGSGKEELARRLSKDFNIPVLTLEKTLTDMATEPSELGKIVKEAAFAGKFSDELIMAALRVRLDQADAQKGFILEDFPRSIGQAETLDVLLKGLRRPLNAVIKIDIEADDLMEHLVGRITCQNCGEKYNIYNNPPIVVGMCNVCGERIRSRPDDYEENIANRLRNCEIIMSPLEKFYKAQGSLQLVPGNHPNKKIEKLAVKLLKSLPAVEIPENDAELPTLPMDESLLKALVPPRPAGGDDDNRPRRRGRPRRNPLPEPVVEADAGKADGAGDEAGSAAKTDQKTSKKSAVKKTVAKKAVAKKPAAKKAASANKTDQKPAGKKVVRKTVTKKAATKPTEKKAVVKKQAAPAKKAAVKKAPVQKTPAQQTSVQKAPAKKAAAKKAVAKKAVAKKAVVKKATVKKVAAKKAAVKKAPAKAVTSKKTTTKKAVEKKLTAKKKTPAKKSPVKKASAPAKASTASSKKTVSKKSAPKASPKQSPARKTAKKKAAR